jgi:hypothetical protein
VSASGMPSRRVQADAQRGISFDHLIGPHWKRWWDPQSNERALRIADELEAAGWHESAGQVRKAAETAWRFQSYARP